MKTIYLICTLILTGSLAIAAGTPVLQHRILPSSGGEEHFFGVSVDIQQGLVIVGAPQKGKSGDMVIVATAYLFDARTGKELAQLQAEDTPEEIVFGHAVALQGDKAFVGAYEDNRSDANGGSVYVFDSKTGAGLGKWSSSTGHPYEGFGFALGITDSQLVVGAPGFNNGKGAVYILDVETGEELSRITAADTRTSSGFGYDFSVSNSKLLARTVGGIFGGEEVESYIYIFDIKDPSNPVELWALPARAIGNLLSLAIDDDRAIIISLVRDDDLDMSTWYLFELDVLTGEVIHESELLTMNTTEVGSDIPVVLQDNLAYIGVSDLSELITVDIDDGTLIDRKQVDEAQGEHLGSGLAVDGNKLVTGATWADDLGTRSGAAYIFGIGCQVDLNEDDQLDSTDVSSFLMAFTIQDPIADFTGDGRWNFFDVSAFLNAYRVGCP